MIQEIKTGIFHNEYKEQFPQTGDYILFVRNRSILMENTSETVSYLRYEQLQLEMQFIYLFQIEMKGKMCKFFLGDAGRLPETFLAQYAYQPQDILRQKGPDYLVFAGVTACQLADWYAATKFCGRCATVLIHDRRERMMRCPKCHTMYYPKISPAVIVGVIDREKERILLTKYAGRAYKNYALIAGFTEIGETVEDTVRREVMEEVGIQVKNIRYYKSQPWSFSDTLLLGFYCDLDGDEKICLDGEELSTGIWMKRDEIPTEFDNISLTNEMIMRFKNGEV